MGRSYWSLLFISDLSKWGYFLTEHMTESVCAGFIGIKHLLKWLSSALGCFYCYFRCQNSHHIPRNCCFGSHNCVNYSVLLKTFWALGTVCRKPTFLLPLLPFSAWLRIFLFHVHLVKLIHEHKNLRQRAESSQWYRRCDSWRKASCSPLSEYQHTDCPEL